MLKEQLTLLKGWQLVGPQICDQEIFGSKVCEWFPSLEGALPPFLGYVIFCIVTVTGIRIIHCALKAFSMELGEGKDDPGGIDSQQTPKPKRKIGLLTFRQWEKNWWKAFGQWGKWRLLEFGQWGKWRLLEFGQWGKNWWLAFNGFKDPKVADLWQGAIIGLFEISFYPILIFTNNLTIIGAWLAIKTGGNLKLWEGQPRAFNRFLILNLINLGISYYIALKSGWLKPE